MKEKNTYGKGTAAASDTPNGEYSPKTEAFEIRNEPIIMAIRRNHFSCVPFLTLLSKLTMMSPNFNNTTPYFLHTRLIYSIIYYTHLLCRTLSNWHYIQLRSHLSVLFSVSPTVKGFVNAVLTVKPVNKFLRKPLKRLRQNYINTDNISTVFHFTFLTIRYNIVNFVKISNILLKFM